MKTGIPFKDRVVARSKKLGLPEPKFSDANRKQRRKDLIDQVKRGLDMTGSALQELRDDEHWKDTHNSFHEFCKETFSISKTKLYTILKGMEVITALPKNLQPLITSDAQVLELSKIDPSKRAKVISLCEQNGGISANQIALHSAKPASKGGSKTNATTPVTSTRPRDTTFVEESGSKTPPQPKSPATKKDKKVELDKVGTPIPDDALPFWNRRQEVQDILTEISRIKSHVLGAREANDPMWMKVPNHIQDTFSAMRIQIMEAYPYAVCTTCMGSPSLQPTGCAFCGNKGLISQFQWERQSDSRIKEIRMKSNIDYAKEHNLPLPTVTV